MTIYQVFHNYTVDGGFGDSVFEQDLIETFLNKADAETFVKEFSNGHCYDNPYDRLFCGYLYIVEVKIEDKFDPSKYSKENMWWFEEPGCRYCSRRDECPDRN